MDRFNLYSNTALDFIVLAVFTPAIYISVVTYHPGFIPTRLALSIAATRAGVPFPSIIEALLMEITIELLRESEHGFLVQ